MRTLNNQTRSAFTNIILAVFMGVGTSAFAYLFVSAVRLLSGYFRPEFDHAHIGFRGAEFTSLIALGLIFAASCLSAFLYFGKIPRFHGPADAIIGANDKNNPIDTKSGLLSALASIAAIGGGAPVGQYGPLVHFGATLSALVGKVVKLTENSREVLLGCGVAAAIAAAFGAPIAGILFAHEVVLRHFALRTFAPVTVAAATAFAMMQNYFPNPTILPTIESSVSHPAEVAVLCGIGLFGGGIAVIFMRLFGFFGVQATKVPGPAYLRPFIPAIVLIALGSYIPQILGLGTETVIKAIEGNLGITVLLVILFLKTLLTPFSISFGLFGGVFSPALFIGVAFGALVGAIGQQLLGFSIETSALCALAGMGAVISSTIGAPITTILIVFELTQDYQATTGVMISVVFANMLSNQLFGRSLFDKQLLGRGFNMKLSRQDLMLSQTPIKDLATDDFCQLSSAQSSDERLKELIKGGYAEGYVVSDSGVLLTKISVLDIVSGNLSGETDFFKLLGNDSVLVCVEKLTSFVGESAPILDQNNNLLGVITEADVFIAYKDANDKGHATQS